MSSPQLAPLGLDHERFIERARSNRALLWLLPGELPWRVLVDGAANEASSPQRPISAAVWEALWRVEPNLEPEWSETGPAELGPSLGSPNPFLRGRYADRDEWVAQATETDGEAGDLLQSAFRAEKLHSWWNPEELLLQHAEAWVTYAAWEAQRGRESESPSAEDPGQQLERLEQSLTRIILVGHAPTTVYVVPELLAFDAVTGFEGGTVPLSTCGADQSCLPHRVGPQRAPFR
jgi:hypothetical protein